MEPFDSSHALGNSYGEYQNYGGTPYMHPGIDILHPAGTPVYAVKAGWVKAVLTTAADLHWRVAIGDTDGSDSCDAWLYAHLDQGTITVSVGDYVDSGQQLGNLVQWPTSDFHHLHFVKIRDAGLVWSANWLFVGNPLDELDNIDDFTAPYFVDINVGAPFRFCRDNSDIFFNVGMPLDGDVDIIAKGHDRIGHPTWVLAPHEMGYEIYSDSVAIGPFVTFNFSSKLLWDQSYHTLYKNSGPCNSEGNYQQRQFFEILTNHDNDSLVEPSDVSGKWSTGTIPNGTYTVKAWAKDLYGNIAWDSMTVTTANFYSIDGKLRTSDGNPSAENFHVEVPFSSSGYYPADSTFNLIGQPAGRYEIKVSRPGYQTYSEITDVFSNLNLDVALDPVAYIKGDVDFNGIITISDAVYLINFIFTGGPAPNPWATAVYIDSNPVVTISDVVFLINFIFAGGPPPGM
ncbi:MAG: peptidoglycan DD-metalloendopeptidase family protein [Candidatus Zixiibacteriota bacterium]